VKTDDWPSTSGLRRIAPQYWTPSVFGVVPPGARRRRPSDIVRVAIATLVVLLTAIAADDLRSMEMRVFDLLDDIPEWIKSWAEFAYRYGAAGTMLVLLLALLFTRRFRLVALLLGSGVLAGAIAVGLRDLVDAAPAREAAGLVSDGSTPEYPLIVLAIATTVLLVAGPYLLRPARRLVFALLTFASFSAVIAIAGLPDDVIGSLALGWGVAAVFHLVVGTPAATPSLAQVDEALAGVGVEVSGLQLQESDVWGETRFSAKEPDGTSVTVEVIGRDATDARLFAKVWRSIWYKDSGAAISLSRTHQLEHRAYLLLLAERAGVPVSDVVTAGTGGPRDTAVLVLHEPAGSPLTRVEPPAITDAVLDDAWRNLCTLHEARVAHGTMRAASVLLRADGTTAFVDFGHASADAPSERCQLDAVGLLVTTAALIGDERALAAAQRALGNDGLADLLPMLEPTALSPAARRDLLDRKALLGYLRDRGSALTGVEVDNLTELRRVSPTTILLAAGTILGVYLLIGELAGIDWKTTFKNAEWDWVVVTALLSPLPQFTGAIAMMGAVAKTLPYRPVVMEQFANNFTGLVGGTVATTALVIRFFQKQGLKAAVAISSGVLTSLSAVIVQTILVIIGLFVTLQDFDLSTTGGDHHIAGLAIAVVIVGGILLGLALFVPRLRKRLARMLGPQMNAARTNLSEILRTPRKAAMLFGGNLGSQLLYAMVIGAALHAYGYSLPLLQIVVINSLASVLGGMAPVPGGMGVIEAGLIGGLTAAGIPQTEAVATTFTARLFTAYLPPIWGWFALRWLRRNEYV
jgi:glycosyltransferase 2 family protein